MATRDEIVEAIREIAQKLGRAPSIAEFRRMTKISWHQVYRNFRGMRAATRAAGQEPGPRGGPLDMNALVLDWARVVRELGRLPYRREYDAYGKHHSVTLHARVGWYEMAHRFVLLVREFHLESEWKDVMEIVGKKYRSIQQTSSKPSAGSIQHSALSSQPHAEERDRRELGAPIRSRNIVEESKLESQRTRRTTKGRAEFGCEWSRMKANRGMRLGKVVAAALAIEILMAVQTSAQHTGSQHTSNQPSALSSQPNIEAQTDMETGGPGATEKEIVMDGRRQLRHALPVYGEPLTLAAMAHAPTNEDGVVFLFGVLAAELGFRVERIQREFPDCEAKREIVPGKWERVRIEFEYESRNFKEHRHDWSGCDVIVCWRHNWPDVPEGLEVVELRRMVG